jgi:hypothetical protein
VTHAETSDAKTVTGLLAYAATLSGIARPS